MDNNILWMKFAEDSSLPDHLNNEQRAILENIFDPHTPQSPWAQAVKAIGFQVPFKGAAVMWVDGTPYMNWTSLVRVVSGGGAHVVRTANDMFAIHYHYSFSNLFGLIKAQWQISRYLSVTLPTPLPDTETHQLIESLALGLCLLALTMRLKKSDEVSLARALATPENLSPMERKTIDQIAAIQKRRTDLSPVWHKLFPPTAPQADMCPPYFWNTPPEVGQGVPQTSADQSCKEWQGIAVAGQSTVGRVVYLEKVRDLAGEAGPVIAVFAQARPETISVFPQVAGVLYGHGGSLSHACTIAREQNIPCVTALGADFLKVIRGAKNDLWVSIHPETGIVQVIER